MSEKIYIIQTINCRGDETINKYSFKKELFFSLLDLFKEEAKDDEDVQEELLDKIKKETNDYCHYYLIYDLLFGTEYFCGDELNFEERVEAIKNGKYCAEMEESMIAVGLSPKEAKSNLVEVDDEDDW